MKYAYEVAKLGSLSKASEALLIAVPNISRSIKKLEEDLGITIFNRTSKGMHLTPEGEEYMRYAKGILSQIEQVEKIYKDGHRNKLQFSISVPRASYISEAFAQFTKSLTKDAVEIFYNETNSQRAISNLFNYDYKLGIIRYDDNYDKYFKSMLDDKGLYYEVVTEFSYCLIMSADNPLAHRKEIAYSDLTDYIEIAHADPYVPSLPLEKVVKEEISHNIERRIFIFERGSQFDLLCKNTETFMWVSPVPADVLERYNLVQKRCVDNQKIYKDVLIYKNGYKLTELDMQFTTALCECRRKYLQ